MNDEKRIKEGDSGDLRIIGVSITTVSYDNYYDVDDDRGTSVSRGWIVDEAVAEQIVALLGEPERVELYDNVAVSEFTKHGIVE